MKHLYLSVITILLLSGACSKLRTDPVPETAASDFKLSVEKGAYLTQVIEVIPTEAKGKPLAWTCDFGNGVKVSGNGITNVPYTYIKEGNYKITYTVGSSTTTKTLKVFPGLRSYQIKSSLSGDLFISAEVAGNRKDIYVFGTLKQNTLTDSVFSISTDNQAVKMTLFGVITGKNNISYSYRTSSLVPPLAQYKHTLIELKDDEPIYVNYTSNGKDIEQNMFLGELFKL